MKPQITYYDNKNKHKHYEEYWFNCKYHRLDGPAFISYLRNGKIASESYWINGKRHRLDGPTNIKYYQNGNIKSEEYYKNDLLHRLDGPAWIEYDKNGNITNEEYWINSNVIPKNDIDEILEQCNNDKQLLQDILTIRYM